LRPLSRTPPPPPPTPPLSLHAALPIYFGLAAQARLLAARAQEDGDEQAAAQLREESNYLRARSLNYPLLFDPAIEFFQGRVVQADRKSTRLNSSHVSISYAAFCLEKKQ